MVQIKTRLVAAALALVISGTAFGQAAPVPAPSTLWSFLGIPQGVKKVQGALTNRRGNRPQAEPKDALKALNDPANLESPDAAIKRAAEIKKAEDLKPQKIKAIKYLTSIGCGCYDLDGSVTGALVAAAEDCTEDVRLVTMQQIKAAACGKCCSNCGQVCCCNDAMLKKLAQVAYERDEFGCYSEPSKRVREAAAAALVACCPGSVPLEVLEKTPEEPAPEKKPELVPETEKQENDVVPERENDAEVTSGESISMTLQDSSKLFDPMQQPQPYPISRSATAAVTTQLQSVPTEITRMRHILAAHPSHASSSPNPQGGVVLAYDASTKTAYVHFEKAAANVPVGTMLHLRPDPRIASGFNGMWQVVESTSGCANLQPLGPEGIERIRVGDHVIFGTPDVVVAPVSFTR